jgi:hypothetical protein
MITCNNVYVHTVEHLANAWREASTTRAGDTSSHSYFDLSVQERMRFVSGTVIPSLNNTPPTTTTLRPTTAEVLAVPTYAAQLGLRPLGIFR